MYKIKYKEDQKMLARINRNYVPTYMDGFFNDQALNNFFGTGSISKPAVNIIEDNNEFRIEVAAPGLTRKDFKINLEDDLLTISSEKSVENDESGNKFMRREFSYSTFKRSFHLPDSVNQDSVSASHSEGILSIHLPKKEEALKKGPKSIEIS